MIENNINLNDLQNPLNEHLFYINEVKEQLIKTWEAVENLRDYYAYDDEITNDLSFVFDRLEQTNKTLNKALNYID
ncbi:hypothetical protein OUP81_001746 [Campylobacter upsaliensis]|uniref:Uncharacterized protein n=1 Tax=Campylobacter upsaliensis TaxID=28080 RepID=A0A5L4VJ30_CAMUP|nr:MULTISPECIES: hypothetical protein [Campylobacter]EAH7072748.1 hypothetical protein [Campylobacter upsaliensis]EAH9987620.1 hypothetical protein [Campylobacter upsaliensis]EAI0687911.1 hypothetical protein [Campylobacter upsaliensis]EAI4326813.1 hypothetical protein [Campylobacter upsaliensis]EAI5357870.1 hypothetical protein [Campylobacter upsaliensis]